MASVSELSLLFVKMLLKRSVLIHKSRFLSDLSTPTLQSTVLELLRKF